MSRRRAAGDELRALFLEDVPMLVLYNNLDIGTATARVRGDPTWQARPRMRDVIVTE